MAVTPRSTRSATRSSPRSAKPTPKSKLSTPQKATPKSAGSKRTSGTKTSPYFANGKKTTGRKSATNATRKASGRSSAANRSAVKEEGDEDDDDEPLSPTGLTESDSESADTNSEDEFDPSEESDQDEEIESELDSDFLDESDGDYRKSSKSKTSARKPAVVIKGQKKAKGKGGKRDQVDGYEDEDEDEGGYVELEEGQEIAGRIYPAPKTGQVPAGRISQNTMNFLKNLQIPERNDRDWFRSHEPSFRQAEKEWQTFVGLAQLNIQEADAEVPILPPKSIIHRIYRDVRFSSDKTPYKKSFSLSTSRGGRKGIWACYHLAISPHERSILACGVWMPGKDEIATIRQRFLTDPKPFRDVISAPEFVKLFGQAKPHAKGQRQNVFGHDDALKVAPKGIEKGHKDIDLLKLRTIAVVHKFSDEEVISEDFREKVGKVARVMAPLVHLLNDMMTLPGDANGNGNNDDEDEEEDDEDME